MSISHLSPTIRGALGGLVLVLGATPAALAADKVYKKGSRRALNVSVVSEDCQTVKYKLPGTNTTQDLDASDVAAIVYDDAPASYQKGLDFLELGDTENAITELKLSLGEKTKRDWIVEYGNFFLGKAYLASAARNPSQYQSAADAFAKVLAAKADSRFLLEALRDHGIALSRAGDPDAAAKSFDKLVEEAKSRKLGLIWEARGKVLKAEGFDENGKPDQAKSAFSDAGNFASSNARATKDEQIKGELLAIAGRAQLSEGVALLNAKKYREARGAFERLAQDTNSPPRVIAGAQCGLGEVLLAEGQAARAMTQFARVRVLHYLQREEVARATYFLGKCCEELGSKEPNGARKARAYFTEVVENYGDTMWANRAQAALN